MAARAVARAVRPIVTWWRALWDVDAIAAKDFRSPAEQEAWLEAARASNAALRRAHMREYASAHILPRVVFVPGSAVPRLVQREGPRRGL